jgi:hypothetical protein
MSRDESSLMNVITAQRRYAMAQAGAAAPRVPRSAPSASAKPALPIADMRTTQAEGGAHVSISPASPPHGAAAHAVTTLSPPPVAKHAALTPTQTPAVSSRASRQLNA